MPGRMTDTRIIAPKNRSAVPCQTIATLYCLRQSCSDVLFLTTKELIPIRYSCRRKDCKRRLFRQEEISVRFCYDNDCPMLQLKPLIRCRRSFAEIRGRRTAPTMGSTTLHFAWKGSGMHYKKVGKI
jgi:hypothetical protein